MKKIINLFFALLILSCSFCSDKKNGTSNVAKIKKIQIKSVDFSIMTFVSVECNSFEEYFKEYKVLSITDTVKINQIMKQFTKLEPTDSSFSKVVNTRAKIELFSDSDTSIICIGNLSLYFKGSIYKTPPEVIRIIENI